MFKRDLFAPIDFTYQPIPRLFTVTLEGGEEKKVQLDNNKYTPIMVQITRQLVSTLGNRFIRDKHALLMDVCREMLFEIFIHCDPRGEYFLQEICTLLIENKAIPELNENETELLTNLLAPYLTRNKEGAIAVDGPKGPEREVKPGVVSLAKATGAAIIPMATSFKKFKVIHSWDRFIVPMPLTSGFITYGDPIYIPENADEQEYLKIIKQKLNETTELADRLVKVE